MVTGPMPRNPKATSPNANTAGAAISWSSPCSLMRNAPPMRPTTVMPSQYAEKLPATRPDRMFSDGPPSREEVTTSRTCRLFVEVNTLTSSGISAPARVPQEMIVATFHHSPAPAPSMWPRTAHVVR